MERVKSLSPFWLGRRVLLMAMLLLCVVVPTASKCISCTYLGEARAAALRTARGSRQEMRPATIPHASRSVASVSAKVDGELARRAAASLSPRPAGMPALLSLQPRPRPRISCRHHQCTFITMMSSSPAWHAGGARWGLGAGLWGGRAAGATHDDRAEHEAADPRAQARLGAARELQLLPRAHSLLHLRPIGHGQQRCVGVGAAAPVGWRCTSCWWWGAGAYRVLDRGGDGIDLLRLARHQPAEVDEDLVDLAHCRLTRGNGAPRVGQEQVVVVLVLVCVGTSGPRSA